MSPGYSDDMRGLNAEIANHHPNNERQERIDDIAREIRHHIANYRKDGGEDDFRLAMSWLNLLIAVAKRYAI